jgi:lipopolysaccharide/colanic/teichoic acid biosynthesis glycosyltransferase
VNFSQRFIKRSFDILFAGLGLLLLWPLMLLIALLIRMVDPGPVIFSQERVGRKGTLFYVHKFRTMSTEQSFRSTVTTLQDPRITPVGAFLRRWKLDELPQLWNVLVGKMSFVGPRPDVQGYADTLTGADRIILTARPGITGPATLKYRNEESLLSKQSNPEHYNREVIWPDKVRINRGYVKNYSFKRDLYYIWQTVVNLRRNHAE